LIVKNRTATRAIFTEIHLPFAQWKVVIRLYKYAETKFRFNTWRSGAHLRSHWAELFCLQSLYR